MIEGYFSETSFKADSLLPQIMIVLPSCRNLSATARPIPLAPPVTKILFPVNFIY
jgi:hypothetical protein